MCFKCVGFINAYFKGVVKLMHLDAALYSDVVLSEGFFHQLFISTIQSL